MIDEVLARLASDERVLLRDLPRADAPKLPGIYSLWHEDLLLYVGIARVDPQDTKNRQAGGVAGRLNTYRRCRLTSDFAIACAFRFVVPELDDHQRRSLADGKLSIRGVQTLVREWVDRNVCFTAVAVDPATAAMAETAARSLGLPGFGTPVFNALGNVASNER